MLISIKKSNCKHNKNLSCYNHNVYELPFEIEGCNCIREVVDELWDTYVYEIGKIVNGSFILSCSADAEVNFEMGRHIIAFSV